MTLKGYPEAFMHGARRFDGGGRPNPVGMPALDEALQHIVRWGPENMGNYTRPLTEQIALKGRELGLSVSSCTVLHNARLIVPAYGTVLTMRRPGYPAYSTVLTIGRHSPHIVGLRWGSSRCAASPEDLAAFLKANRVHVSVRSEAVRISVGMYVSKEDVDTCCHLLHAFFMDMDHARSKL
ncbi:hypothetical protein CYMTET_51646 [Cymbomonas tetramitiformis]|uniref:Aminotransferase class V domain-containing protein n=1 Tax=Cymbomonas tetramitiformis TaxID=36881 RepID=A0AAE0BLU8_9CHLO|nr:hypothetical protein CYMTET_51646 [Cymbomonas tetramitiformis]